MTTSPAELRDRIAALFRNPPHETPLRDATPGEIADAVLAVLPEPADRAAVLRKAADALATLRTASEPNGGYTSDYERGTRDALLVGETKLHRMADETATETPAAVLTESERKMLAYALDQAQEHIWSRDGFTDEDQAAVDSLRRLTTDEPAAGARQDGAES